jgi:hypothetical protein
MILIEEHEVEIRCDAGDKSDSRCRSNARYVVTLKLSIPVVRLYCAQHTAELLQGAAKVLRQDEKLSNYVETEFLMKGQVING